MANRALPIIFLNLSGEMIYVIQQRLEAQNISKDKASKVIWDIINTMLNDQFMEELFKPQNMYSREAMQSVFEKLVHSSIMRLNTTSMSKLYDLMLMVFKYQVVNCPYPEDIILVTLNHMDAIKNCTAPYPELKQKFENIYFVFISEYKDMSHHEYESLYNCISVFLQDLNIRVSVLMRLGWQSANGEIVRPHFENSMLENCVQNKKMSQENIQENWKKTLERNCFELDGNRGLDLGTNIYIRSSLLPDTKKNSTKPKENGNQNCQAIEEITLLSRLIGNSSQSESIPLLLQDEDISECRESYEKDCCFVTIDASQTHQNELGQISNEFTLKANEEKADRRDILELLDCA